MSKGPTKFDHHLQISWRSPPNQLRQHPLGLPKGDAQAPPSGVSLRRSRLVGSNDWASLGSFWSRTVGLGLGGCGEEQPGHFAFKRLVLGVEVMERG